MPGNTIGEIFCLTTFGESHSQACGGIIDGCPAGLSVDFNFIQQELERRKPVYIGSTERKEPDVAEFLSGLRNGRTLGSPIAFLIRNVDIKTSDYQDINSSFRPSHADFTYFRKYGVMPAGGGRASGRETAARVVGGAIAKLFLKTSGIVLHAHVSQIGDTISNEEHDDRFTALIEESAKNGDTLGGTVTCRIENVPAGLGEPVFDKLQADLAKAMLGIGSAKAFEYGFGFRAASMKGSEYNDQMTGKDGKVVFLSNHDGGIQGGISNGEEIFFRVGFKPVPSIKSKQSTVNIQGESTEIMVTGRHDSCHVPRLVVVVESMAALVIADHLLRYQKSRLA
jgi:chorismate synthase